MSDQTIAIIVGTAAVVVMRIVDWMFPKGYVWRRIRQWSVKIEQEDEEE